MPKSKLDKLKVEYEKLGNTSNLSEDNLLYPQPQKIKIELLKHQKTALNAMVNMERTQITLDAVTLRNNIGILTDKVGSGKSLTMLSLISANNDIDGYWSSNICSIYIIPNKYVDSNFLFVPANILVQWENYILTQTELTYKIIESPEQIVDIQLDVYLISCENINIFLIQNMTVKRLIIDEIDSISSYLTKNTTYPTLYDSTQCYSGNTLLDIDIKIRCKFMWLLTATPMRLLEHNFDLSKYFVNGQYKGGIGQKKLQYYFKTLQFPYFMFTRLEKYFMNICIHNNEDFVDTSLNLIKPNYNIIICKQPNIINIIGNLSLDSIVNCLNAHDFNEIAIILGCPIIKPIDIINKVKGDFQVSTDKLKLLLQQIENIPDNLHFELFSSYKVERINKINNELKAIEIKIESIESRLTNIKKETCCICFDNINLDEPPILLECCNNFVCTICLSSYIKEYTKKYCMYCRQLLKFTLIAEKKEEKQDKISNMLKIIKTKQHGKFLIFSNHDNTFKEIGKELNKVMFDFQVINSKTSDTTTAIRQFNSNQNNILLLNSIHHGAGINLQSATDIIVFHKLDRFTNEQVIGRGQRYGRTCQLNVHYLLYDNER